MQNISPNPKKKNFIQRNKWWTALIVFIALVGLFLFIKSKKVTLPESLTVQKHNIVEEVSATGNVKALSDLDLSFQMSGQVSKVNVSVGDKVSQGQILASLSNGDLTAALEQAKAGLKVAQANLASLQNGSTPEQIAVNESQVEKAKNDLSNAKISLVNSIKDAYTKSDDAIRNYTDVMFTNPRTENPVLLFQTDAQLQTDIVNERVTIENLLSSLNSSILTLDDFSNIDSALSVANNTLTTVQTFLQKLAYAVNKLSPDSSISQTTLTLWKTNISTSRASIDLAISSLSSASNQYQSSIASLNVSNSQLTLIKTGATIDQLKAQEAVVEQAKANVDAAQANLSKSIIISPISGVITNVEAKVGQIMQPGVIAVSVISYGEYDVESYVPEADIAKVKVGDRATTTLDAYGSDVFFDTSVIKIDPAETIIENVPTYKVTLKFSSSSDSRIKSGMTANLDILTGQKNDVLAAPSRSIYSIDVNKYVMLVDSVDPTKTTKTQVETGMRGVDGYTEIISGLKEGDKIIASPSL